MTATFANRVTERLGVDIPIVQAPMGWIARSHLASAVPNAGAMGIIETSSGELDIVRVAGRIDEVRPVADIIAECANGCLEVIADLARRYPAT